jgi:surfeit locus 1 family protein
MSDRKFQPGAGSTIVTMILFTVLMGLGLWQVQRLEWKTQLLAQIDARMAEKPVPMPETIDNPADWRFRRVTLAGNFDYAHEFLIKPRTYEGQAGYEMIVPFRRASGGTVFVNRGWISDALMDKAQRPDDALLIVEGIVQAPEKARFTPENDPAKGDWYWPEIPAMAAAAGLEDAAPVIVVAAEKKPGVWPAGGRLRLDIPNDHRQYAAFWFAMAFVLLAVYVLSHWRRAPKLEENHAGL